MIHPDDMSQWESDCRLWRGRILTGQYTHWCYDWDGLPVDETCIEARCCTCFDDEYLNTFPEGLVLEADHRLYFCYNQGFGKHWPSGLLTLIQSIWNRVATLIYGDKPLWEYWPSDEIEYRPGMEEVSDADHLPTLR